MPQDRTCLFFFGGGALRPSTGPPLPPSPAGPHPHRPTVPHCTTASTCSRPSCGFGCDSGGCPLPTTDLHVPPSVPRAEGAGPASVPLQRHGGGACSRRTCALRWSRDPVVQGPRRCRRTRCDTQTVCGGALWARGRATAARRWACGCLGLAHRPRCDVPCGGGAGPRGWSRCHRPWPVRLDMSLPLPALCSPIPPPPVTRDSC